MVGCRSFPGATMTKDHEAGNLEQQKLASQLWSYESEIKEVWAGTLPFATFLGDPSGLSQLPCSGGAGSVASVMSDPATVAHQAPLSVGFSGREY